MAKNKDFNSAQVETFHLFGGNPKPEETTPEVRDEFRQGRPEKIQQIGIFEIYPDLTQPRRALPSVIRAMWDGQPVNLPQVIGDWLAIIRDWRNLVMAVLDGEDVERPEEMPVEVAALVDLATLAASIRQDGLMNPISLVRFDGGHLIEAGERRWLAFHLLHAITGDSRWQVIPARIVPELNRWRQAAENNTRSDLNAIGKARQFAVLLMDLLGWENFIPLEEFDDERDFYAQVADGEVYRIPRGTGERLVNALGLKNGRQLRDLRGLLRLSADKWRQADDENWAEWRVRSEMEINKLVDSVPTGTVETDDPDGDDESVIEEKKFENLISQQLKKAKKLPPDTLRARIGTLREMIAQMETLLKKAERR
jgi:hypothetical protein